MSTKKVLIVTYYWPPAGGIAVQRVTKFCKYLIDFGWEPIILTVKNGNYDYTDESLLGDIKNIKLVYYATSIEPHTIYNMVGKLVRTKNKSGNNSIVSTPKRSWFSNLSEYIRLNLFIPDTRVGWLPSACNLGNKIISKHKPDIIFSTAPPYTPHLIAMKLHNRSGIPWVADFRDPWVESTLYNTVKRLNIVKSINRLLEKKVVSRATSLVFTGPGLKEHYAKDTGIDFSQKASVITNGFDPVDLPQCDVYETTNEFDITYFGSLYCHRFHSSIFQVIGALIKNNKIISDKLRIRLIGNVDTEVKQFLIQTIPGKNLYFQNYTPYKQALKILYNPQVLLLLIDQVPFNDNITLGKVFDYIPTGNPILGIGPTNGDTARILKNTGTGLIFDYKDKTGIESYVLEMFEKWKNNTLKTNSKDLSMYYRQNLTSELASIFNSTTNA